jgi:hypothetical protein
MSYHRARWYDARNASWLSEDPAGTVDSSNLYAYVGWGPQGATDPLGECLGFNEETCAETGDRFARHIRRNEGQSYSEETGVLAFLNDWKVGIAGDAAEMFLADPLRAGQATGDAVGRGAGIVGVGFSVVQDTGRVAGLLGGAGGAVKATGSLARSVGVLPRVGSLQASILKGKIGEGLAAAERFLRGERIVADQVTVAANGARARFDLLTKSRLSGQLRLVEAKLGDSARLTRGQPIVAKEIELTGTVVARGRKSVEAFRSVGVEGGSYKNGLPVTNVEFVEQRFSIIEYIFDKLLF